MKDINVLECTHIKCESREFKLLTVDIPEFKAGNIINISPEFKETRILLDLRYRENISQELSNYFYDYIPYLSINEDRVANSFFNIDEVYKKLSTYDKTEEGIGKYIKNKINMFDSYLQTENRRYKPTILVCNNKTINKYENIFKNTGKNIVINNYVNDNDIFCICKSKSEDSGIKYFSHIPPFSTDEYYYKIYSTQIEKYAYKITIQ